MPNINAALGCAQIENLEKFIIEKRQLASNYIKAFENVDGVSVFTETEYVESNYWLNAIIIESSDIELRDEILELLNSKNYMSRPVWTLLHKLKPYQNMPCMDDINIAERIETTLINLPSSPKLMRNAA
jgi:perosamine synthetase